MIPSQDTKVIVFALNVYGYEKYRLGSCAGSAIGHEALTPDFPLAFKGSFGLLCSHHHYLQPSKQAH
jgi:hypothetical protein